MKKLCTQCLYVGLEESTRLGNFKTEIGIWIAAFVLALTGVYDTFFWLPATILFFVALFYTITISRLKYCVCSNCKHDSMIPIFSPKAQQIMRDHGIADYELITPPERALYGVPFKIILLTLTTLLIALMLLKEFG